MLHHPYPVLWVIFEIDSFSKKKIKSYLVPTHGDNQPSAVHVARLLHEADLQDLIPLDWLEQIKFFLSERSHLLHQVEIIEFLFYSNFDFLRSILFERNLKNNIVHLNVVLMKLKRTMNDLPLNIVPNRKNFSYTDILLKHQEHHQILHQKAKNINN